MAPWKTGETRLNDEHVGGLGKFNSRMMLGWSSLLRISISFRISLSRLEEILSSWMVFSAYSTPVCLWRTFEIMPTEVTGGEANGTVFFCCACGGGRRRGLGGAPRRNGTERHGTSSRCRDSPLTRVPSVHLLCYRFRSASRKNGCASNSPDPLPMVDTVS